ncbi:ABC transporter permease [Knoellia subterranea]|uniref:ABC transporter permease n=1 Tax=Knoellia subterranea KCTC 19937 TaxID=1385521 RepID=A0A0A0JLW5_9MICO|nr:FtsX-like permease family protein [Knoellia subterranea]KGN36631.1 ABC transporter permease [Knoellia subterranea KCTC 19937]
MLRASWKSLMARKLRLFMSAFAIILGVAFVAGSFVFTDTLGRSFDSIMTSTVGDVVVRPVAAGQGDLESQPSTATVPGSLVKELADVPGAARADGNITNFGTFVVGKNGKLIGGFGPPGIGVNFTDGPAAKGLQPFTLTSGHWPQANGEVVLDEKTAQKAGYLVGEKINLVSSGTQPRIQAKLVGITRMEGGTAGASISVFTTEEARTLFMEGKDVYSDVWVTAASGTSQEELRDAVAAKLPKDYEAVTGDSAAAAAATDVQEALGFITTFLLIFAGVALVVGSFLIVNTFSILVAQRSRELALFRALGSTRRQVARSVLFEATVTGLIGSILGLGLGVVIAMGIRALFGQFGLDLSGQSLIIAPRTIVVSLVVGLVVTLVAAYLPARNAGKVPPVAAMRDDAILAESGMRGRTIVGTILSAVGIGLLGAGLFADVPKATYWVGAGILGIVLGVALISPLVGRPVIAGIGWIYRKTFGAVGLMAQQNAQRNPRRTGATASALMIGVTLVSMMAVFGASAKASVDEAVDKEFVADYVVSSVVGTPFSPEVTRELAAVKGVDQVAAFRWDQVTVKGSDRQVTGIDPSHIGVLGPTPMVAGKLAGLTTTTVSVSEELAKAEKLSVGSKIDLTRGGTTKPFTVGAIHGDSALLSSDYLLSLPALESLGGPKTDSYAFITREAGASAVQVGRDLDKALADLPVVTVKDQGEFADEQRAQINQMLYLIYALLGLAVIIAILGIINTLALSVIERTKEIGLLRAVGLSRRQLKRMLRLESIVIALLGAALGIGLGVAFGVALQRSLADDGIDVLAVPWPQLGFFVALAGLVGVVAAWWPGWRASRLDILRAVTTE